MKRGSIQFVFMRNVRFSIHPHQTPAKGSEKLNIAPPAGLDTGHIGPSCASMMAREMAF